MSHHPVRVNVYLLVYHTVLDVSLGSAGGTGGKGTFCTPIDDFIGSLSACHFVPGFTGVALDANTMSLLILARLADHPDASIRDSSVRTCEITLHCLWVIAQRFRLMALPARYLLCAFTFLEEAALYTCYPILPFLERNVALAHIA